MWGPITMTYPFQMDYFGEVVNNLAESQGEEIPCDKELAELLGLDEIPLDYVGDPYGFEGIVIGDDGRVALVFSLSQDMARGKDDIVRRTFVPTAEQLEGVLRWIDALEKQAAVKREAAAKKEWMRENFPRIRELETSAKTRAHIWDMVEYGKLLVLFELQDCFEHGEKVATLPMIRAIFRGIGGDGHMPFGLEKVEDCQLESAIEQALDRGDLVVE